MADVAFITIVDASKVSVSDVPFCTGEVFFPVLNTIIVLIT